MSKAIDSLHSSRADARTDLLHGTLDMLILRTLQWGPQHGYAISQAISRTVRRRLQVEAGSLYPALQRLAKRGGQSPTRLQVLVFQLKRQERDTSVT
jgi:hypothetical protein